MCGGVLDPCPPLHLYNSRYREDPSSQFPNCWDRNDTVSATSECRDPDTGDITENCVEIGYTSTAYIMDCKNEDDMNGGTFVGTPPGDPNANSQVKTRFRFRLSNGRNIYSVQW